MPRSRVEKATPDGANLATSRGIVNGCTSEMDSLTLDDNSPTLEETLAKMRPNDTEVALDQPPLSINVIPHLPQEEMALLLALAAGLPQAQRMIVRCCTPVCRDTYMYAWHVHCAIELCACSAWHLPARVLGVALILIALRLLHFF